MVYGGGNLRAAVFGVNDGLVSNASLIMGVAGAGTAPGFVLTAGVAGLLAGALSMAAGEYVSVRSQREMYEYQIALERDELDEYPDEEAEELALIYQARGMDSRAGPQHDPRAGQAAGGRARHARTRGAGPESGGAWIAAGGGNGLVPGVLGRRGAASAPLPVCAAPFRAGHRLRGDRRHWPCSAWEPC